ncbi:MAG: aryl-sulfate sulfotransferase [Gemmatimonadales bacterium]
MADAPVARTNTGAPPPPPVQVVVVDSSAGPIFRSLRVAVAAPESVQVEYWTAGGPRLKVTAYDSGQQSSIFLPRLRPQATYDYQVTAVGSGGVLGASYSGSLTTDSLPSSLAGYRFQVQGAPSFPLAMLELTGAFAGWVMVDTTGQVVWFRQGCYPEGFTRRANGNFVLLDSCTGLYEVAPDGHVVDSLANAYAMNHDVIATPQNTLLFIGEDSRLVNDTTWTGNGIWEWSPEQGSVVQRWSSFDVMSPVTDRGPASTPSDWLHANSLAIGPRGNVVVSFLFAGEVISLSPDFSTVEWRLGGPNSSFAVDSDAQTYGQHTAAEISPDHILVFDNLTYDSLASTHYSRGLEIALDTVTHTAHKTWEFRPQPDDWAPYVGSDRLLPNGDRVVSFGLANGIAGASGPVAAYEVTLAGAVVWRLEVDGPSGNYRTTPLTAVGNEVEVP